MKNLILIRWIASLLIKMVSILLSGTVITMAQPASDENWTEYINQTPASVHKMWLGDDTVEISYASQQCIGEFRGKVIDNGGYLIAFDTDSTALATTCTFKISPAGENAYRIQQGKGCSPYHGATCNLSGRVVKAEAFSPSFDCLAALTETEQTVCNDRNLSLLDQDLSRAYRKYVPTGQEVLPVPKLMVEWRKWGDSCGTSRSCINLVYRSWIFALAQDEIVEQLEPPPFGRDNQICFFHTVQTAQTNFDSPKVYSCFNGASDLHIPTADACHIGDSVYRLVQDDKWALQRWDSIITFLKGESPTEVNSIASLSKNLGRDHYDTGCLLHSCISAGIETPDGDYFASPRFYFWLSPDEWNPIVYPSSTMFIFEKEGKQYPDVQFCRYITSTLQH